MCAAAPVAWALALALALAAAPAALAALAAALAPLPASWARSQEIQRGGAFCPDPYPPAPRITCYRYNNMSVGRVHCNGLSCFKQTIEPTPHRAALKVKARRFRAALKVKPRWFRAAGQQYSYATLASTQPDLNFNCHHHLRHHLLRHSLQRVQWRQPPHPARPFLHR